MMGEGVQGIQAPPAPLREPAPSAPARPAPDAKAIEMLRQSPDTAPGFDAVYGVGQAQKVLGIAPARSAP